MKMKLITAVASVLTLFALLFASSACMFGMYQPEEPEALKR
jgi:cyclic lactone autoinducer peptide